MTTVQIEQGRESWLELRILSTDNTPILLVEASQVRVFYKKHGALTFTQKTGLVDVADTSDPQTGENFAEIGFGVYAVLFSETELNTAKTMTWVVIPDDPDSLDFVQWNQQIDIVPNTDVTSTVTAIASQVGTLQEELAEGFDASTVDLTAIQGTLSDLINTLNAVQGTVDAIEASQGSGINVRFVN